MCGLSRLRLRLSVAIREFDPDQVPAKARGLQTICLGTDPYDPRHRGYGTELAWLQLLGEPYELGHHSVDRSDPDPDRRLSRLAAQQWLGLRALWWCGADRDHPHRAGVDGAAVTGRPL